MSIEIIAPRAQPFTRAVTSKLSETRTAVVYQWVCDGVDFRLVVPSGYRFDGASIPRFAWTPLGLAPHGVMDGPALLHDYTYNYQGDFPPGAYQIQVYGVWQDCKRSMPRSEADELLRELCRHFKVGNSVKIWLVWAAVRSCGWWAWMRDDADRKQKLVEAWDAE